MLDLNRLLVYSMLKDVTESWGEVSRTFCGLKSALLFGWIRSDFDVNSFVASPEIIQVNAYNSKWVGAFLSVKCTTLLCENMILKTNFQPSTLPF